MADKKLKPIELVSKSLNKKGEIRGKNKKETKTLKGLCTHHKYNKHGKVKPTIFNNHDGACICTACLAKFPARFYEKDSLGNIIGDMKTLNEQAKYMAVACGAGNATVEYFAQFGVMVAEYKKNYNKLKEVAEKENKIKDKKNKHKNNRYGSEQLGSWGRN